MKLQKYRLSDVSHLRKKNKKAGSTSKWFIFHTGTHLRQCAFLGSLKRCFLSRLKLPFIHSQNMWLQHLENGHTVCPFLTVGKPWFGWFSAIKGPRFGGALDDAARMFCEALDLQLSPENFVQKLGWVKLSAWLWAESRLGISLV